MNYTYKNIWLINFPVMMSILIEQLINITDAIFLGHVGEIELGASALAGIWYLAIYMLGFSLGLQIAIVLDMPTSCFTSSLCFWNKARMVSWFSLCPKNSFFTFSAVT